MIPRSARGAWWPDAVQKELITAIIGPSDRAASALSRWRSMTSLDELDIGSRGLLPLLADRLGELGSDHPDDAVLRSLARHVWARNHGLVSVAADTAAALGAAGINPVLLKGIPLVLDFYPSIGSRQMGDVDVLVPEPRWSDAADALVDLGWHVESPFPRSIVERALVFRHPAGFEVDLQWRLLFQPDLHWIDDEVRDRAVSIDLRGQTALRPGAGDFLFHVLVHGAKFNDQHPLRWLTDADAVIAQMTAQDWDTMISLTDRSGLVLPVRGCLAEWSALSGRPLPTGVGERLTAMPVEPWRRVDYHIQRRPGEKRFDTLTAHVGDARRRGVRPSVRGLWKVISDRKQIETPRQGIDAAVAKVRSLRARRRAVRAVRSDRATP